MKWARLAFAFSLLVPPLHAADEPKAASLSGTVVKEPGDQPLKKVLFHLVAENRQDGGIYTAESDPEGHFHFDAVQPGRYRLLAEKTGFHQVNARGHRSDGGLLTVQPGEEITGLFFQMLQPGIIYGRVVDEDGDPLPAFGVSLLKRKPGKVARPELAAEDRTDDLGNYRFAGLFPGQYYVAVVPPPDIRNFTHVNKTPTDARESMTYLTTFYPGTSDGTMAAPIDVRTGDELPVNFAMIPGHSYRIRGLVTGIGANQKPIVQLFSRGVIRTMNGAEVGSDGQFEIRGVAPGSYLISVSATLSGQVLSAQESVKVVAADVEGVKVVPNRPFMVSGHVTFEPYWPKDAAQRLVVLRSILDSEDPSAIEAGGAGSTEIDQLGNFRFPDTTPGNYVVELHGGEANSFLKEVIVGRQNQVAGFQLTGMTSIELVVSERGATIEGVVSEGDKAAPSVTVVAIPDEKFRAGHLRFGVTSTDQHGHFTMRGLAPGSYTLFAWQDLDDNLYYDPAFLKSQEGNGTTLSIEEGARQRVELKVSPLGEDWQ